MNIRDRFADSKISLLQLVLYVAMVATVLFIFVNSMLPPDISSEQSAAVGGFISSIIPPDTALGSFILDNLRKIAHFTEYGLLGMEIALHVTLFGGKSRVKKAFLALPVPLFVGFTDETIQIFSGRGPEISDVWIDIGGFIFFSLIAYGVLALIGAVSRLAVERFEKKNALESE